VIDDMRALRARLGDVPGGVPAAWAVLGVVTWLVAGAVLPRGLPLGTVLLGVVLGSLQGFTAMGLVLVYRSTRIINLAQAEIGGLAATVAVIAVTGWHVNYFVAAGLGLAVAVATGAVVELVVVRRFANAPRLILTVATIGVLELLGAAEVQLPRLFAHLDTFTRYKTPWHLTRRIGPVVFNGDHLLAVLAVPVLVGGLMLFLSRSDTGVGVRAAAESPERALLLGIPVRRLSLVAWCAAAGLGGVSALLSTPIVGRSLGAFGGPVAIFVPLAAAAVARFESLPTAAGAAIAIGVFQQAVSLNSSKAAVIDLAVFVLVLVALLLQRKRISKVEEDGGLGGHVALREPRPIPEALARLPEVRWTRMGLFAAVVALALFSPAVVSTPRMTFLTYTAMYGVVAVSLVVLTGWAGQISLGQFAFVGVGAGLTGALLVHAQADLFLALLLAAILGGLSALLVGLPAMRIKGLFLAAATLAFAVPVSTMLLNGAYFSWFSPHTLTPPLIIERFDTNNRRVLYYLCLAVLAGAIALARNLRRSRAGRAVLGVRDNERAASSYGINPVTTKLAAFAFSGALAGVAGGLFVVAQRGIAFSGFDPALSLQVFVMVVLGGLGSIPGAVLGAFYIQWTTELQGGWALLASGVGVLALLMFVPGGLASLAYQARDWGLRQAAKRRGLAVDRLVEVADEIDALPGRSLVAVPSVPEAQMLLHCEGVDTGYGTLQILFGVDVGVADDELLALLGTNGAGKSTLLRVVAGLNKATGGRVVYEGRDITALSPVERVRAGIVMVPGGRGVFGSLTVGDNLRLAAWTTKADAAFVDAARARVFELFPVLRDRLNTPASMLSGGEQQMLTLAQALLCRPKLLLIDELSLGLAPSVVSMLLDVVRRINDEGVAVVVVEQSVNVATSLAQRAVFMEKGTVRFSGPTAELVDRPDLLRSVFLGGAVKAARRVRRVEANGGANGGAPRLQVVDLSKRFGGVAAVDGVSFEVGAGRIVGVIGSNGAGKTTMFDLVSGFVPADAGHVLLEGRDVTEMGASDRAELGLGRSFQDARLFPSMTVREALATALDRHVEVRDPLLCMFRTWSVLESERTVFKRVDDLLDLLSLGRFADAFVSELSTGTKRVVELGCAMAHAPSVLLLDEPSSGIAQRESEALAQVLLRVRDDTGASLAVVEHDIPLVSSISDSLICLHLGQVIASGPPRSVLRDPAVVASYLGTDEVAVQRSGQVGQTTRRSRRAPVGSSA
jgi:ABC-type branched-subunit amino acid transport system ATPase component/ABC-type branched-subunit amino acid transport system permease subunit